MTMILHLLSAIEEAFKVVDELVPIMADLVSLGVDNRHKISEFKVSSENSTDL